MNSRELYDRFAGESHFALTSYMQGVGESKKISLEECLDRLDRSKQLKVVSDIDDKGSIEIEYRGEIYSAMIRVDQICRIRLNASHHPISESELDAIKTGDNAVTVGVDYSKNSLLSYQMQLKLISTLTPNIKVVIDLSLGTILSGKWVKMTADSKTTPDAKYLYAIDMKKDSDNVWFHTHGLLRAGSPELEILGIPRIEDEIYPEREVLDTIAKSFVDGEIDCTKPDTPFDIGYDLTGLWREWEQTVTDEQREMKLEIGHIDPTGVICLSQGEDLYHVNAARDFLLENPLNYFTTAENQRRAALAVERLPHLLTCFNRGDVGAIVKHGVVVDDQHQESGSRSRREFIWFQLVKVQGDIVTGVALNTAYAVKRITKGAYFSFDCKLIDDWQIVTKGGDKIVPDTAFLL